MNSKWNKRFLDLAGEIASWPKDPSTKVGCVLVDDQRRVVGIGYNGFPRGVDDNKERYENRDLKYLMVQHAEANAILNAVGDVSGTIAYVTHHPCSNCLGLLIQASVRSIVTNPTPAGLAERFKDSFSAAKMMAEEAGIEIIELGDDHGE